MNETYYPWIFLTLSAVAVFWLMWWQDFEGMKSAWIYHRTCRTREKLTGDEFFQKYYAETEIPSELAIGFRQFHATYFSEKPELLRPEDDLFQINSGLDFAEYVALVQEKYGVRLPEKCSPELRAALLKIDMSFDCTLRAIHFLQGSATRPTNPPRSTL